MKNTMNNRVKLQGYLYEHKLESKVSGPQSKNPGTPFINGTLDIATDSDMTNIVSVHFTYVTPTTKSGQANRTYGVLNDIISGKLKSAMADGAEVAAKLEVSAAVDVNDFYTSRNGEEELVSAKRNEGSFVTVISSISSNPRDYNDFDVDMVINGTRTVEADEARGLPEKLIIKGCVFNFRKEMKPVEFSVLDPNAISYFESLEANVNNPVFTHIRGTQVSTTVVTHVEEANAFGESYVRDVTSSRKDWVVNWASAETYLWDDESTITAKEMEKAIADRNVYLAGVKQRREEYLAAQAGGTTAPAPASNGGFNF